MSYTIAITGKGGVGKTTLAALIVQRMIAHGCRPVLAVDADPNTSLDTALGIQAAKTVGGVREEARVIASQGGAATGMAKQELLDIKIAESLVEGDDFDFIAMGRPEGPGCYCFANNALKSTLQQISKNYPYVVIDNEAGLENLSRRLVQKTDLMIMVADSSRRGLETLQRLYDLAVEMKIEFDRLAVVVNRVHGGMPELLKSMPVYAKADVAAALPEDPALGRCAEGEGNLRASAGQFALPELLDRLLSKAGAPGFAGAVEIKSFEPAPQGAGR